MFATRNRTNKEMFATEMKGGEKKLGVMVGHRRPDCARVQGHVIS